MQSLIAHAAAPGEAGFPGFSPHLDVLVVGGAVAAGYLMAIRRRRRAEPSTPPLSRLQVVALVAALAAFSVASFWPIHDFSEQRLFSVHMVQHTVFSLVLAPLVLIGTPAWMARAFLRRTRLFGFVRRASRFLPATVLFNVVLVVTHIPAFVNAVVGNELLHFLTHCLIVATALIVWMPILSPLPEIPRLQGAVAMVYLFLQSIVPTVPASFLTFGARPLYSYYADLPRIWGITALDDMQMSGLVMKVLNGLFLWVVIAIVFFRWYDAEESGQRSPRRSRPLDRDLSALGLTDS